MNKKTSLILLFSIVLCANAMAQRRFYHRIDVGSSNIYTFVLSNIVTGFSNYYLNDIMFEDSYVYTIYDGDPRTKAMNPMGFNASDLFNDAFAGLKLGYQSDNFGKFNWGIYASGHYRVNQFKSKLDEATDYTKEIMQYVKPGGGILLTFGSVENELTVQLEAAARYDIPLYYKGMFGTDKSATLNEGISSHYSIKFAGHRDFSIGLFLDLTHYNTYKYPNVKLKPYSFGVSFTITPKRGHDLYD